jgi:hypothetical protein
MKEASQVSTAILEAKQGSALKHIFGRSDSRYEVTPFLVSKSPPKTSSPETRRVIHPMRYDAEGV